MPERAMVPALGLPATHAGTTRPADTGFVTLACDPTARAKPVQTGHYPGHCWLSGPGGVMELEVTDHPENARFEVRADGELVGFVDYRLGDGEIALLHAETDSRFRRRGIAGRLVQSSLDSARERQLAVLPYCSFVRRWIADHPGYADLVPADRRRQFGLLATVSRHR